MFRLNVSPLFLHLHRPKIVTTNTKIEQREKGKERKALAAAQLDRAIEKELLERLRQATEGEIFNYPEKEFGRVLSNASKKFRTGALQSPIFCLQFTGLYFTSVRFLFLLFVGG